MLPSDHHQSCPAGVAALLDLDNDTEGMYLRPLARHGANRKTRTPHRHPKRPPVRIGGIQLRIFVRFGRTLRRSDGSGAPSEEEE